MQRRIIVLILLGLIGLYPSPILAQTVQPQIPFTRIFKVEIQPVLTYETESYVAPIFYRHLGNTAGQLMATYFTPYGASGVQHHSLKLLKKKYTMETFRGKPGKDPHLHWIDKGMYILQNNATIGYCLLESLNFTSYPHDATIPKIKALPVNTTYLQGKFKTVPGMTITVYEANHPDFVERYVLYKKPSTNYQVILLDAFYPKELDAKLEKHLLKILNYNIENFNIHLGLPQGNVARDDDEEAQMSRLADDHNDIPEN